AVGFTAFDILGFPLLGATALCLTSKEVRRRFSLPGAMLVVMAIGSIVLGILFRSEYYRDWFTALPSVHFFANSRWFLLPFAPVCLWLISRRFVVWLPRSLVHGIAALLCLTVLAGRFAAPPCGWWEMLVQTSRIVFEQDEWLALAYLREHTPAQA